jgi:hypothetical protein
VVGTILNKVFGTSFKVMNNEEGRKQTTKGTWIGDATFPSDESSHFLILDSEGVDSAERGEERGV